MRVERSLKNITNYMSLSIAEKGTENKMFLFLFLRFFYFVKFYCLNLHMYATNFVLQKNIFQVAVFLEKSTVCGSLEVYF